MAIKKIGVLGAGLMGAGIAQVAAVSGYEVTLGEVSDELLQKGLSNIEKSLAKFAEKGTLTTEQKDAALGRLRGTTNYEDFADCDIVIEAIIENLPVKREVYAKLDALCKAETIFASNTSSLSITEIAAATSHPERVLGLHFFNPVPLMKLVEIIRALPTSDAAFDRAKGYVEQIGKTAVICKDTPGFVVNRLLVPYLLDAVRLLESGIATREDIDNGMKLGCGYPMGPLTLLDFVGLDTTYYIANIMFEEFRQPHFAPPPLLKRMVLAGYMGRKSGRGFYEYTKS